MVYYNVLFVVVKVTLFIDSDQSSMHTDNAHIAVSGAMQGDVLFSH